MSERYMFEHHSLPDDPEREVRRAAAMVSGLLSVWRSRFTEVTGEVSAQYNHADLTSADRSHVTAVVNGEGVLKTFTFDDTTRAIELTITTAEHEKQPVVEAVPAVLLYEELAHILFASDSAERRGLRG